MKYIKISALLLTLAAGSFYLYSPNSDAQLVGPIGCFHDDVLYSTKFPGQDCPYYVDAEGVVHNKTSPTDHGCIITEAPLYE